MVQDVTLINPAVSLSGLYNTQSKYMLLIRSATRQLRSQILLNNLISVLRLVFPSHVRI